ncbi:MAG: DUF1273 domain-containing protein [Clostridia bacterium]|nr:DUF1273 domain-containing protein [Clostridia bacterium]
MWNIKETACLSGHRPNKLPWFYDETKANCIRFKQNLQKIFTGAYEYGLKNYLVGMAEGCDMIGAETLIKLRKTYKDIKIFAIIPCKGQEKKWRTEQQIRYQNILKQCDGIITLSEEYTPTCMNERNEYMVKHSSVLIACYNGKPSGTANTIRFAKEKGIKLKIIDINNYIK